MTPDSPEPANPAGPQRATPIHAVGVFCFTLLFGLILLLVGEALGGGFAHFARITSLQIGGLCALLLVIQAAELQPVRVLGLARPDVREVLGGLFLGAGLTAVISATLARLYALGEAEEHAVAVEQTLVTAWETLGPVMVIGWIVLIAPLVEELVFRGMILRSLLGRLSPWLAVLISTAMFAVLHGHLVHGSITAVLGLVCAMASLWRGHVWIAVAIHAAYNTTALLFDVVLGLDEVLPLWTILPGLAMMGLGIGLAGLAGPARRGGTA